MERLMHPRTNGWGVEVDDAHPKAVVLEREDAPSWIHCYDRNPLTPAQARDFAAALLRAADEAEGRIGTDMSAEEIVVRSKVADELEALPRYNDIADWCAHIGYRQAVDTARSGRRRTLST